MPPVFNLLGLNKAGSAAGTASTFVISGDFLITMTTLTMKS